MNKCIWYISKYVTPPGQGSAGSRGYFLMRELSSMGYEAIIITSDSNILARTPVVDSQYMNQQLDGIEFWWVRTLKYYRAKSMRRILSWLHFEWRLLLMPKSQLMVPDAIIVSSLSLLTILNGILLRRKYECRLVFEVRDIWPLTLIEEGGYSKYNPFVMVLRLIEKLGYRQADTIVGTMPNLIEHVAETVGQEKDTRCIPMGYSKEMLSDQFEVEAKYTKDYLPENKFLVVHAGAVGISNALDTLLECANLLSSHNEIHFVVLGDGDLLPEYKEKYAQLSNLTFAPKVEKRKVGSVLQKCDLLYFSVHSSGVWRFGQSLNKVVDYMLAGKPIVASYAGFQSMINEAKCGSFVPPNDLGALKREILKYSELPKAIREEMGECGRRWILENRKYERLAEDYLQILYPHEESSGNTESLRVSNQTAKPEPGLGNKLL